jgi:hypothetical protein
MTMMRLFSEGFVVESGGEKVRDEIIFGTVKGSTPVISS